MEEKPLDGLLIVLSHAAMAPWEIDKLRTQGALVIIKRPHTELEVKRLGTGEPLETALDIMDDDTWVRLVELRERLISARATEASVHILHIP